MKRLAAFVAGLAILWLAVASPLGHHSLTAHMVQHLLIMIGAAPLILLASPSFRAPVHPVFCWLAGTVTVIAWHVPAIFELARQSYRLHLFEQASFLVAGLLFWSRVIRPRPERSWWIPLYLFLATLPCDALSAFLVFGDRVVYRQSSPQDQSLAGALMWVVVTLAYLIPALGVTIQLLSGPEPGASLRRRSRAGLV